MVIDMETGHSGGETTAILENTDYTLQELFEGNVFHIPRYQRFYSWERSEWSDLWSDLTSITGSDREHYMGTVICKAEPNPVRTIGDVADYREYAIVDGQQRLTTIVLLVNAISSMYSAIDPEELSENARAQYESSSVEVNSRRFVSDPAIELSGKQGRFKLQLQDDDNDTFEDILRDDIDETATETPSQERLVEAYRFYLEKLRKVQSENGTAELLDLVEDLLATIQSLQFIVYTIESPEQATLIFESINDRGIGLSNLDKTKSFLMHKVYLNRSSERSQTVSIDGVQRRFGRIYRWMQDVVDTDRTSDIGEDQIQRYHYISRIQPAVNAAYLRQETNRRNKTFRSGASVYLDALKWHFTNLQGDSDLSLYESYPRTCLEEIDQYTDSLSRYYSHMETIGTYGQDGDYNADIDWELRKIFALDRLGNFYPLLLTVWDEYDADRLSEADLHEILQLIEVASFRIYTTVSRSDTGRNSFYNLANNIGTGEKDAALIIGKLKSRIQSKENDFESMLRNQNAYNRIRYKDLRYLLYSYELYLRSEAKGGDESSIERAAENAGNDYTLDHIWPNDAGRLSLTETEEEIHKEYKHNLGNLTLTTGPQNSAWKNRPYPKKRDRTDEGKSDYLNSDFTMTRKIARNHEQWGKEEIEQRLDEIVDFATRRWSLDSTEREPLSIIRPSSPE
jgi:hypothetical protein